MTNTQKQKLALLIHSGNNASAALALIASIIMFIAS